MPHPAPFIDSVVFVASPRQITADFAEEVVILHREQGVYYSLNSVGAFVWQRLAQPISVARLREALAAEYDVDPAQLEADLQALLQELCAHGLVDLSRPA